ncbi:MAG TPA: MFS transporter [Miltoncostaea sp.]|nr:MFS transporter [Miltoncostaea sp.]
MSPAAGATGAPPAGGFVARTVASLRSRNFRLFFVGQTISNTGNWLTMVALTLLVLHRTGSGTAVGVLSACQFGPMLVLSPFAGVLVDRTEKRRLLVITQLLEMGQSCVLAVLALLPAAPLGAFYATAAAGGCMLAFDNPVRRAFVNEMVPLEDVPNAVTVYSAMVNLSRVAGPALAGVLVVSVGYAWTFTVDAISYLAVLIALAMMRPAELRRVEAAPREPGQIRAAVRYVRSVPELWISFAMVGIVGTLSYNFPVVFPLLVEKALHGDDGAYTLVYSVFSLGSLVGALAVARRTTVTIRTVSLGAAWLGVAMLALAAVPSVAAAVVVAAVVGAGAVAFLTAATAIAQVRTEQRMIGRVLGLQIVLVVGTTPLGGPLLGALSDAAGARAPVVAGAAGALAAAAFGVLAARKVRGVSPVREGVAAGEGGPRQPASPTPRHTGGPG